MSDNIFVVTAPQLGTNDEIATVVEWHVLNEETISVGEPLCTLETTKAVFDVEAEATGYVVYLVDAGDEVKISQPIALIGSDSDIESLRVEKTRYISREKTTSKARWETGESAKATWKAKDLAQRLGLDLSDVPAEGIIREQDVLQYHRQTSSLQIEVRDLTRDPERTPVIIYGASKGGVALKECLEFDKSYQVVCFIDDNPHHLVSFWELPVYHGSQLRELMEHGICSLTTGIASGRARLRILKQCEKLGIEFINAIHPQAYIAPSVQMGKGAYVKARAIIETNTVLGNCCIIDNGAIIAHDNVIGDGCHITPGVSMGSSIKVGELTVIGVGASVATGVQIGRSVIISIGSSIVKNVPDYAVVEGVPGRIVGRRKH